LNTPIHLIMINPNTSGGKGNNKFYDMIPQGEMLIVRYGRIFPNYNFGESGAVIRYHISEFERLKNGKIKKGYNDMSYLIQEKINKMEEEKKDNLVSTLKPTSVHSTEVIDVLKRLYDFSLKNVIRIYGREIQITPTQKEKAQEYLNFLSMKYINEETKLQKPRKEKFNESLIELFKVIPRSMNNVGEWLATNKQDFNRIIEREQNLLDSFDIIQINNTDNKVIEDKKIHTPISLFGFDIHYASLDNRQIVSEKLKDTNLKVLNVFKITTPKSKENFENFLEKENLGKKEVNLFWHGSRSENILSIMKQGFLIRPTNAVHNGSMFGDGIYLANDVIKSLNYTSIENSYWAKGEYPTGFLILVQAATGGFDRAKTVYEFKPEYYRLNKDNLGNNQKGKRNLYLYASSKKGMLRKDEIVFYNTNQVNPYLLVEVKRE